MKSTFPRIMLFVVGFMLIGWALLPGQAGRVGAAPPLVITETPAIEPPTRTPVPPPTNTPAPAPSLTPVPPTPVPPVEEPGDEEKPTATPTIIPTPTTVPIADPAITKSVNKSQVQVGDSIEFTLTVTNLGSATASDVVVDDSLPSFLALEGASASRGEVSTNGSSVHVVIGDLAPGEVVTITISARVTADAVPPANVNTATVVSSSPSDNPNNNSSSVELFTVAAPTAVPATLPRTGGDAGSLPLVASALGVALIMLSLFARRRSS